MKSPKKVPIVKVNVTGNFTFDPTEFEDFDKETWEKNQMSNEELLAFIQEKMQSTSLDDMQDLQISEEIIHEV